MQNFEFFSPTKVVFGKETQKECGRLVREFGGTKALVHFGGESARKSGVLAEVEASLSASGIEYVELGGVHPNPLLSFVREGIELCRRENVDFIVAVGGGSVIDSSKAIAVGLFHPDIDVWDFYLKKAVPDGAIPVGAVLTIAAAGSETSSSSVITNEDGLIKRGMNTDFYRPRFAIMNPELTYTLPKYQSAAGVTDIMMHTMDRYFSGVHGNCLTDDIADSILKIAVRFGPRIIDEPCDYEARSEIMWAGSLSHNTLTGLGRPSDFSVHQLGHELSALFDVTHGATLSALWASWARYVYKADISRFAKFARNIWGIAAADMEQAALSGIATTENFFASIGMPTSIEQLLGRPLSNEEILELAKKCSYDSQRTVGVFRPIDREDMLKIYTDANC